MSLRLRIVLLMLLAILTPAALLGVNIFRNRDHEIDHAKESLNALAKYAAEDLQDKVNGTVQLLHGLSRAPDLDTGDKAACSAFLGNVLGRYPQYTGLLTIRPDGQLHCDSLRSGRTLDLNDRAYFKQASASAEPAFEAAFGRLTGIAVLQVAYPSRDVSGNLKYVLLASLNLAQFGARFATASAHDGMAVLIWDGKGTLLVRHPEEGPRKLAGTSLADSALYRFVQTEKAGETAELPGPDGAVKIWASNELAVSGVSGLRITLGIPRDLLLAKADQDLRRALIVLTSVSLIAFLVALLFAEKNIRRPVARIAAAAARQGGGDFSARIGAPYPGGELGGLMATLDAVAATVQMQQVEIERNSELVRHTNRALRMLSGINTLIVRVRDREELFGEACRIAVEEGEFGMAWIGILDRGITRLVLAGSAGGNAELLADIRDRYLQDVRALQGDTLSGQAVLKKMAVVCNDLQKNPKIKLRDKHAEVGNQSMAVLPLIVSNEVIGVLALYAREVEFFHEAELKVLTELAGDIAFAIDHIEKQDRLDHLAYYDALTGLANRTLFHERLSQFVGLAAREDRRLAVVMVDIERFRFINDTLGRAGGDDLLRQIAARAEHQSGDLSQLARIGADHFVYMIQDMAGPEGVEEHVEQAFRDIFGTPFRLGETELRVAARFGIALFPGDAADADALLRNAEAALKKAKAGGERYLFYVPQMTERVAEKLTLENKLRLALENEEFVLHYQPKVDLESRRIVGVEALIRWQSPELGLVPPVEFIPLLEETGLILPVGAWALRRAALDHREWREAGFTPPRIAVNVSPIQLRQRDFVHSLKQAISEGDAPTGIDLEITESLVMEHIENNIRKLQEVRELGLSIAIDDFGTGYSSLAWLSKLPVQTLKIDRSFIITMLNDPQNMTMVSTIISLAHSLRLTVVAEGVDAEDQAKMLRLIRCDQMQGYLFSRPVPKGDLLQLLQRKA